MTVKVLYFGRLKELSGAAEELVEVREGAIRVGQGEKGLLCTTSEFGNYEFKCDFRCPATTNSR